MGASLKRGMLGDEVMLVSPDHSPIDEAVDRLAAAYRAGGLSPIRPAKPGIDQTLVDIEREIAPLRLPAELARFWRAVDPSSITVAPFPHPTDAEFALRSWQSHLESPGMIPRLLFPVAYESWGFLFVELDDDRGQGGAVTEWDYGGSPFHVRFAGLSGYLDLLATMIELGEFANRTRDTHSWVEFDPDRRWADAQAVRLTAAQPLPRLGVARKIDEDLDHWPEHWRVSNGLSGEMRAPRGATATIAQLLERAASGTGSSGTIRATVASLIVSGKGSRATVEDGTGALDVWCPGAVTAYGPAIRRQFEFDVVVRPNAAAAPDWLPEHRAAQDRALAHDLDGAQAAVMDLYAKAFQKPAAAEATAVRPLD